MGGTPAALIGRSGWKHACCVVATVICDVYQSVQNVKLKSNILVTTLGRRGRALPKLANTDLTSSEAALQTLFHWKCEADIVLLLSDRHLSPVSVCKIMTVDTPSLTIFVK